MAADSPEATEADEALPALSKVREAIIVKQCSPSADPDPAYLLVDNRDQVLGAFDVQPDAVFAMWERQPDWPYQLRVLMFEDGEQTWSSQEVEPAIERARRLRGALTGALGLPSPENMIRLLAACELLDAKTGRLAINGGETLVVQLTARWAPCKSELVGMLVYERDTDSWTLLHETAQIGYTEEQLDREIAAAVNSYLGGDGISALAVAAVRAGTAGTPVTMAGVLILLALDLVERCNLLSQSEEGK